MVAMVVARDHGLCHICGHWCAYSADHIEPVTESPARQWDFSNLKAAHGYPKACPDCTIAAGAPVYCNEIRSAMSVERARRIIEERTGLKLFPEQRPRPSQEGRW